ncbi:alpha/beta hydrolase [Actinomyces sp. MRS3W]|uniref:alpha/beta hydrolase n=1 Tax=Actinomyces sp. MRS3W TaxID=2800796 RepID=UPI0028FD5378|nr:alpha/beta hydrolase [Actinomyces sp. MRS3W]MDU0349771.1 alpha/beta hydrolase [Actinomyces sp. MRS3W]
MYDEKLELTQEWDKTFPESDKVDHEKVTFHNRYGITLAADLYVPMDADGRLPAVAVCGPFGAVKEQCSGLYAQTMAERGFLAIAFDPSFTGESGGAVRDTADPAINTEDFSAAVDYLSCRDDVDPEKIAIIGICGWGGFALNAAAMDTRVKATVTSTMYDMTRVSARGYFDSTDEDARYAMRQQLAAARTADYSSGAYSKPDMSAGAPDGEIPQFVQDYMAYYAPGIGRAFHPRAVNFSRAWVNTSTWNLVNMPILQYAREIRSAVLMVHGEKAHSCYFSRDAFADMTSGEGEKWAANKELVIIPDAVHTDLYDNLDVIPFDEIVAFLEENLK